MRVQLLSDLHLEFQSRPGWGAWVDALDPTDVDVLCLAGDIALLRDPRDGRLQLEPVLRRFCDRFPEVVFVLGNHEFYHSSRAEVFEALRHPIAPNLHWLEDSTVTLSGQRFVGSTLWFPRFGDGLDEHYGQQLNDFALISGFRGWVYQSNQDSMRFLAETVESGDVVVSHHIPTIEGVHPRWMSEVRGFGRFFLSQLPREVLTRPSLWMFGHTHESMAFELEGWNRPPTRFRCNPYGYHGRALNPHFDPKLILEV